MKLNGESTKRHYSVITLGSALPGSSMNPHAAGIRYIQATFFAFTISVPLAHLVVVTYLWLVPLKFSAQRKVFVGKFFEFDLSIFTFRLFELNFEEI